MWTFSLNETTFLARGGLSMRGGGSVREEAAASARDDGVVVVDGSWARGEE